MSPLRTTHPQGRDRHTPGWRALRCRQPCRQGTCAARLPRSTCRVGTGWTAPLGSSGRRCMASARCASPCRPGWRARRAASRQCTSRSPRSPCAAGLRRQGSRATARHTVWVMRCPWSSRSRAGLELELIRCLRQKGGQYEAEINNKVIQRSSQEDINNLP